jgi:putative oxidoreductase
MNALDATPSPFALAWTRAISLLRGLPAAPAQLALRCALAVPFWNSGMTKWDGVLRLSDNAVFLFAEEFRLHLFGQMVPYPWPTLMAWLSGIAEVALPVLLVLGLGTRFAALGLLAMTAVIQLTVPDGWASFHLPWAAMALAVATYGPGILSLDHLIARRLDPYAAARA